MKKTALVVLLLLAVLTVGSTANARPSKDLYEGKTAGNSGFTNIVGNNYGNGDVTGWVRYSKNSKSLHTTWVVQGLEPGKKYQLKLHTKTGDDRVDQACDNPGEYVDGYWECGDWGSEGFLVMALVTANEDGHIGHGVKEDRLPSGEYSEMQFIVTKNESPWYSAWTWENPGETISAFTIK